MLGDGPTDDSKQLHSSEGLPHCRNRCKHEFVDRSEESRRWKAQQTSFLEWKDLLKPQTCESLCLGRTATILPSLINLAFPFTFGTYRENARAVGRALATSANLTFRVRRRTCSYTAWRARSLLPWQPLLCEEERSRLVFLHLVASARQREKSCNASHSNGIFASCRAAWIPTLARDDKPHSSIDIRVRGNGPRSSSKKCVHVSLVKSGKRCLPSWREGSATCAS